jgi:sporulation protein YlmC with PRC-barrel domain
MADVPVYAKVECADGPGGQANTLIVNPTTHKLTHYVVEDKTSHPSVLRLVPVEQVAETTRDTVRLGCTRAELADMEPFLETHYVVRHEEPLPTYPVDGQIHMVPRATVAEDYYEEEEIERIPPGELAVRKGTQVVATDGVVGHVAELVVDLESGYITHMVLEKGHLFGKKEITVPVSAIDYAYADTVHLKLDKKAVSELPATPVRWHFG